MKSIVLILIINSFYICTAQTTTLAFCCQEGRGCKGSMYCTACKNCTGCKHCTKNGGSCGVCRSSSKKNDSSNGSRNSYNRTSNHEYSADYKEGDFLLVTSPTLNLREGPGKNYKILQRLKKSDKVKLLKVVNLWLEVQIVKTKTTGYIYSKYTIKL